ncbi:hypothetical protein KVF89_16475 [Nocardioides carbamazepini]|uniref:DUF6318 family protein n=1 Tax=Nocardioides carbamazepini TaxID=2854259 RepID=UPI00214A6D74|nr:DUF6318 family protein [Nocardioides carbamazepini]MCR1784137.1 hypothetical protein [Nocardioides carbamazepini]
MRTHRTAGGPPALGLLAATLALLLSAAACTGDDPDPRDPSSTWSPTGTMDLPSPTATEPAEPTEPVLPDAAKQASEDGARAFITYYWDLINYAQVTGDVKALKAASGPSCEGCLDGIQGIRDLYKDGGHAEGGDYAVSFEKVNRLKGSSSLLAFEALLTVANTEQLLVSGDGSEQRSAAGSARMAVATQWTDDSWQMEVMDPQ